MSFARAAVRKNRIDGKYCNGFVLRVPSRVQGVADRLYQRRAPGRGNAATALDIFC
jgi:hypothetical protein